MTTTTVYTRDGDLHDYYTGERIRPATPEEERMSDEALASDGVGAFEVEIEYTHFIRPLDQDGDPIADRTLWEGCRKPNATELRSCNEGQPFGVVILDADDNEVAL